MTKPIRVKAFGSVFHFPADAQSHEIESFLNDNEPKLNPDYKTPASSKVKDLAKEYLGVDVDRFSKKISDSRKSIADRAEESAARGEDTAAPQVPGAPVRQSTYNSALLNDKFGIKPQENLDQSGILGRISKTADEDIRGQGFQENLRGAITDAPPEPEGGFIPSAISIAGLGIRGAGRIGSDYLGAAADNSIAAYGQKLIDENPVAIRGLEDIQDKPFLAVREALGTSAPTMTGMVGAKALGMGITSLAPLTGPAAPVIAAVGQVVQWLGPASVAALPSYASIRDKQILNDPLNEADGKAKAIAALGAGTIGVIEQAFGPQQWAMAMLTKEGRSVLARKFAATTTLGAISKGVIKGGAIEGAEGIVQNPIEQLASFDDPTTKENIKETIFGGAMGAIGGGVMGGGVGGVSQITRNRDAQILIEKRNLARQQAEAVNRRNAQQGHSDILNSGSVDEAIQAANESTSRKTVTKDDVLRTIDPTLADIERLTGLKPSESIEQAINQAQQGLSAESIPAQGQQGNIAPDVDIAAQKKPVTQNDISEYAQLINDVEARKNNSPDTWTESDEKMLSLAKEKLNSITQPKGNIYEEETSQAPSTKKSARILGNSTEIVLPDSAALPAQWEIVDADNIKATIKEGVNQPRDRTRASSDIQIQEISNNLDYRRLSDSPVLDIGAPAISHDGLIVAGNGRFEAVSLAHDKGTASDYLSALKNDAVNKGIDPAVIESMKKPVLVRRITQPYDTRKLAIDSNAGTSLQYSGMELAKIDAERMKGIEDLDITDTGDIALTGSNIAKLKQSLGGYNNTELASLVDKNGALSQDGVRRVRNSLLAKAYGDSDTLGRLIESTDNDARNVLGALTRSAGVVAKARSNIKAGAIPKELDITNSLLDAVETLSQIRTKGQPLEQYLAQDNLFGDDIDADSKEILKFLHDNIRSQKKLTAFIKDVYGQISSIDQSTEDIFGDNVIPSKQDVIQNAKQATTGQTVEQQDIFAKQPSATTEQATQAKTSDVGGSKEGWVIRNKTTGEVIFETHDQKKVNALNTDKYEAVPVKTHLVELNDPDSKARKWADRSKEFKETQPDTGLKFSRSPEERIKDRERAKQLESKLKEQGYNFTIQAKDVRDFAAMDRGRQNEAVAAEQIAANFRKRIVWIEAIGDFEINGVMIPSIKDTIFIDVTTDKYARAVMGHELSHHMERDNPDLYRNLVDSLENLIKNHDEYADKYGIEGEDRGYITKEIVGDIMGDNFTDQEFWNKVAEYNPSAFRKIADKIISWLKNLVVKAKSRGLGSEQWVTDAQEAQDIIAKAVAKYTNKKSSLDGLTNKAMFQKAWHGSPFDHEGFDSSKIGTGEGVQAFGFGHYFSDSKHVAEWYKNNLSKEGKLYEVELAPKQDEYLLYDATLDEQSDKVRNALRGKLIVNGVDALGGPKQTGADLYKLISQKLDGDKEASKFLHKHGIRGIKYLDGSSRYDAYEVVLSTKKGKYSSSKFESKDQAEQYAKAKREEGFSAKVRFNENANFNYVIFDDKDVSITAKFSKAEKDYRMEHKSPGREGSAPLSDLTGNGLIYPDDVYSNKAVQYYGTGDDKMDRQSFEKAKIFRGKPDAIVEIYRAVPKDVGVREINSGDWVTINKTYAKEHGESYFAGSYAILSKKVRAGDIFTNGDSIHEWGYEPEIEAKFSKEAKDTVIPKTINIDGVGRPTRNSEGKLIHPTEDGIRNFYEWFGDSVAHAPATSSRQNIKMLPPMILYHGTKGDFSKFVVGSPGRNSNVFGSWDAERAGIFFTQDKKFAESFSSQGDSSEGGNVVPVYLRAENPIDLTEGFKDDEIIEKLSKLGVNPRLMRNIPSSNIWGMFDKEDDGTFFVSKLKEAGYDSAIITETNNDTDENVETWVIFDSNQIKSATGNIGAFSSESDDIRFSRAENDLLGYIDGKPYRPNQEKLTGDEKQLIIAAFNENVSLNERVSKLFEVEESTNIKAKSIAFQKMANKEGYVFHRDTKGEKYFLIKNKDNGSVLNVRVSDHSKVNSSYYFKESDINLAPEDGEAAVDTFASALWKMRNATVDEDGNTLINGEEPIKFSRAEKLYSKLQQVIANAPDKMFSTGKQTALWLQANHGKLNVKKDELHWTGVLDWLNTQGKVSKEDVLEYLASNGVQIKEVEIGDQAGFEIIRNGVEDYDVVDDSGNVIQAGFLARSSAQEFIDSRIGDGTKFAEYVPPGGKPGTYRELLLTLPYKKEHGTETLGKNGEYERWIKPPDGYRGDAFSPIARQTPEDDGFYFHGRSSNKDVMESDAEVMRRNGWSVEIRPTRKWTDIEKPLFTSDHYPDNPNILAHLRVDEVEGANGERLLRVVEIQSDWQATNRKALDEVSKPYNIIRGPFVEKTEAYVALSVKKAIAYAAQNDMDGIVFATGQQNADFYDLSKQVSKVVYQDDSQLIAFDLKNNIVLNEPDVAEDKLQDYIGKEVALKLIESKSSGGKKQVSGLDLKVGGEGMLKFYDEIIPQTASKVLKQISADTKVTTIDLAEIPENEKVSDRATWKKTLIGFEITPDMQTKVMQEGLPLFSKAEKQKEPLMPESKFRKFQRFWQDDFNRFVAMKEWLADRGINLSEQADVSRAEERYHSKVANQIEDFNDFVATPLIEKIAKAGFSMSDIADYLEAQHAEEANDAIAKLHKDPSMTAYGITNDEAEDYLSKAPKELGALANEFRNITEQTKKLLLDNGLRSQEEIDAWEAAYKHYIPVKGGDKPTKGTGKGLAVNSKTKRRLGHGRRDEAVIENILLDYNRAVIEVEKNRIAKHLGMMAAEIAMPELMTIGQPVKRKVLKSTVAYEVQVKGVTRAVFDSKDGANVFKQMLPATDKKIAPSEITINPTRDQRIISSASPMLAENEINMYIDGHAIRIQINDEIAARAYKHLGIEGYEHLVAAGRAINGYLSKAYTGYAPEWGISNIIRDFTAGIINLTGEEGIVMAAKAVKNYPGSFASLLRYAFTGRKQSNKWIDMYRANGGNTGAAWLPDMERLSNNVASEYAAAQGVVSNLKQGDMANASRAALRKLHNVFLKWLNNLNQASENAMRLAAFKAMIESGKSVNEASHIAKNITINFNKKGEFGQTANAAYLFFNATMNGQAAMNHALFKGKHKYQAWAFGGAGLTALGYTMAAMLGGGDEDEYDKLDDYTKERNMVIKSGDGWIKIPVPYGHGFFWSLGRSIADAQRKDELGTLPWHIASSAIEELTPFGGIVVGSDEEFKSDQVILGLLPTVAQIVAQPALNKSIFSGGEIMPESPFYKSQPDRDKMWRGTKGTIYDKTAEWFEDAGIDISPETLKHLTRSATGGAGSTVDAVISSVMLKSQGAELDANEMPFARKLYHENTIRSDRAAFQKARGEAGTAAEEFRRASRDNDLVSIDKILKDKHEMLMLDNYANKLQKFINIERDEQDAVRINESIPIAERRLKLKEMETKEAKFYDEYLNVFKIDKSVMKERLK